MEVRRAILFGLHYEPEPLLILYIVDGLLAVYEMAEDDIVGEPFLIDVSRILHELFTLPDYVQLRTVGLCAHRVHTLSIIATTKKIIVN